MNRLRDLRIARHVRTRVRAIGDKYAQRARVREFSDANAQARMRETNRSTLNLPLPSRAYARVRTS